MSSDMNSSANSFNKFICRCENCNASLIFDSAIQDYNGKCTPLGLDHKRHFCSAADKIPHECRIVEHFQKLVEDANNTELSSFELELRIVGGVKK